MSKSALAEVCGCTEDQLITGKLACIQEGDDKHRIVFDATDSVANQAIRMQDQLEYPGLADM